jgi:hypothetical protein
LDRAVIGTLNSLLQPVQTAIAGVMESHLVTRRTRFGIPYPFIASPLAISSCQRVDLQSLERHQLPKTLDRNGHK